MYPFKFTSTDTDFGGAEPIEGYDSFMWVERYRDPGEFEIVAKTSSGLHNLLTRGSFISHQDTFEVMIVEDHVVEDDFKSDPKVTITGRSMEVLFENRIVGQDQDWSDNDWRTYTEYTLASGSVAGQIDTLIRDHGVTGFVVNSDDAFPGCDVQGQTSIGGTIFEPRELKRDTVHKHLVNLLGVEDWGIRIIRKHPFTSQFTGADTETWFYYHKGNDVSHNVRFSVDTGDIENLEYLWSLRAHKTAALVSGGSMEVFYADIRYSGGGSDRRVMLIDGSDIDKTYEQGETFSITQARIDKMKARAAEELSRKEEVEIISVDISKTNNYKYRDDYDIGDIVSVAGDYNSSALMRVVEFAEIDDTDGMVAYPTLSKLKET